MPRPTPQPLQVATVLLSAARHVCASTWALRRGYCVLHTLLRGALLLPLRALAPADFASTDGAAAGVCSGAADIGACTAGSAAAPDLHPCQGLGCSCGGGLALPLCTRYQTVVVLLVGFVGSTWAIFQTERRLRLKFLASWQPREPAPPDGGAAAATAARAPEKARAVAAAPRLGGPAPTSLDFCLNFALPAVCCMWSYVALFP